MLSIYTIILPRLELPFLEEWISHHISLGVDKIHIYNNGFRSVSDDRTSRSLSDAEELFKWKKKPDDHYCEDLSDEQVTLKLTELIDKFPERVTITPWAYGVDHNIPHPTSQAEGYKHCVDNNPSDWWLNIDPDEYLYSTKGLDLKNYISKSINNNRCALWLNQRVFKARSVGRPVRAITEWGYDVCDLPGLYKSLVSMPVLRGSFISCCHKVHSFRSPGYVVPASEFRINHYRGWPKSGMWHMRFRKSTFNKIDKGMLGVI